MSITPEAIESARAGWIRREPRPAWQAPLKPITGEPVADEPAPTIPPPDATPSPAQRRCDAVARLDELERQLRQLQTDFYGHRKAQQRINEQTAVALQKLGLD